ncbi:glycoside hydrolase superfamily [Aspergillus pseudocaelatus]|uniref:cellulase n=1 Tax=Aspergillus pseudocaelatus TaxID=1825620 RepID=A0ABQ6WA11_9EURO|nr:glycoside hydrolase superfamily [Aspergillus pseudocaelatus]
MNIFRIQFKMERLVPDSMTGAYDEAYLQNLTTVSCLSAKKNIWGVDDACRWSMPSLMRVSMLSWIPITMEDCEYLVGPELAYCGGLKKRIPSNFDHDSNGEIISTASDFQTFWKNLAGQFKSNSLVIFDTNNEYHDMDQELVLNLNQAAIDGIREAGATEQYIFVEGNSYTGAWTWTDVNDNMKNLEDPQDKIVYQMHQYLDSDGSGTSETCVSGTIGQERVTSATQWLKDNKKVGIIGEFAGGNNDQCKTAVKGMLDYLAENTDVWKGALWWAAGPWWGDYMYNLEPPNGVAFTGMMDVLQAYLG